MLAVSLAGALLLSSQPGHAQSAPTTATPPAPPWSLGAANVTPVTLPPAIRQLVADDLEYDGADPILGVRVDLNGDGFDDYFITSARSLCGTGGCIWDVIDGRTSTVLMQTLAEPLFVLAERAGGYPNIAVYAHLSADSGTYATYAFDGRKYERTISRTVQGAELDILIAKLRQIPSWPK